MQGRWPCEEKAGTRGMLPQAKCSDIPRKLINSPSLFLCFLFRGIFQAVLQTSSWLQRPSFFFMNWYHPQFLDTISITRRLLTISRKTKISLHPTTFFPLAGILLNKIVRWLFVYRRKEKPKSLDWVIHNPLGNEFVGKWNKFTITSLQYKSRQGVLFNFTPWRDFKVFYSNLQEVNILWIHSSALISALAQWNMQFFGKSKLLEVNIPHHVLHNLEFVITCFVVREHKSLDGPKFQRIKNSFISEVCSMYTLSLTSFVPCHRDEKKGGSEWRTSSVSF